MTQPKMRSNSSIFERRGDPWVTDRNGREDFGRNLETENPEMDQYTRASRARERFDMGSEKRSTPGDLDLRRRVNILARMHREMREASKIGKAIVVKDTPSVDKDN